MILKLYHKHSILLKKIILQLYTVLNITSPGGEVVELPDISSCRDFMLPTHYLNEIISEILKLIAMKDELMDEVHPLMDQLYFVNSAEFEKEVTYYLKSRGKLDIDIPLPQTS